MNKIKQIAIGLLLTVAISVTGLSVYAVSQIETKPVKEQIELMDFYVKNH